MFDFLKKPSHFTIESYDKSVWIPYRQRVVYLHYKWVPFKVKLLTTMGTHLFDQMHGGFCRYRNYDYTELGIVEKVEDWLNTAPIRREKPIGVKKYEVK